MTVFVSMVKQTHKEGNRTGLGMTVFVFMVKDVIKKGQHAWLTMCRLVSMENRHE